MTATLDRCKVSDRKAMFIVTEAAKNLGCDPNSLALNRTTIQRTRQKHRANVATRLKSKFSPEIPLTVHWDGKLMPDLTGNEHIDRLPVVVTGMGISQLLAVPKIASSSGEGQAAAVYAAVTDWEIEKNIAALRFDTTSTNTGRLKGACVYLEQKLNRGLLWFACRHHVFELVIGNVFTKSLAIVSSGPDIVLFKRFKEKL